MRGYMPPLVLNPVEKWRVNHILIQILGGDCLPPRGVESNKRKRQYEHIKDSALKRGAAEEDAERIAAGNN